MITRYKLGGLENLGRIIKMDQNVQHVFIVGAKGLGDYGGFETFVKKLIEYQQNNNSIQYHVACKANGDGCMDESKLGETTKISDTEFMYKNAHCFKIHVPEIGSAQAIYYDVSSLNYCCKYIRQSHIEHSIVYILACRIGPFTHHYYHEIHKLGGQVFLNPDGHEWARAKWNALIRNYWKLSERMMVKNSDLVICDSKIIERYIHDCYDGKGYGGRDPKTTYIAYGAETRKSELADNEPHLLDWFQEKGLKPKSYYLVVGRFVPENNYEIMIREFMKSDTKRDFALITNVNDQFLNELEQKLHFHSDPRIKFVGTVYDQDLLMKIRENAYAYFHGHEVGGTNPSLLEALSSTDLNMLLDVEFNREVAEDAAFYWGKEEGSLSQLIGKVDHLDEKTIKDMGKAAKERIHNHYTWESISNKYINVFLNTGGD